MDKRSATHKFGMAREWLLLTLRCAAVALLAAVAVIVEGRARSVYLKSCCCDDDDCAKKRRGEEKDDKQEDSA